MSEVTYFRGYAGEIAWQLLKPGTLFTAIPVGLIYGAYALVMAFSGLDANGFLSAAFTLFISGYLVGRFALPAVDGEVDQGFFSKPIYHQGAWLYAARYVVITVLWAIPVAVLAYLASMIASESMMAGLTRGNLHSLASSGFGGVLGLLIFVMVLLAPTLSFIIVAVTDDFSDLFSLEPWQWVFSRFSDVLVLYVAAIGGMLVFWFIWVIPIIIIAALIGMASPGKGAVVFSVGVIIPFTIAPILIGRLCGAFIHYQDELTTPEEARGASGLLASSDPEVRQAAAASIANQTSRGADSNPSSHTNAAPELTQQPTPATDAEPVAKTEKPAPKPDLTPAEMIEHIKSLAPEKAAERLGRLDLAETDSLSNLYELQLLALKTGDTELASKAASKLMLLSVDQNKLHLVVPSFIALGKHRFDLNLIDSDWYMIHEQLVAEGRFANAGVALAKSASTPKEQESLPARLLTLIEQAKGNHNERDAIYLAKFLLKNYPGSDAAKQAKSYINDS